MYPCIRNLVFKIFRACLIFITAAYLIYLLEKRIANVWIGFYHEPYAPFKFVDHTSAMHTYWGPGQPNRQQDQRSCAQANVTGSNFGVWDDMDCGIANPFICEIYKGIFYNFPLFGYFIII